MPWGPQHDQLYETSTDPVEIFDLLEAALAELGVQEEKIKMTAEPPIRLFGALRYSQKKTALAKLSQKIRFVIEVARGVADEGTVLSISAQGGDHFGTGSKRGVELIANALDNQGITLRPLPHQIPATEFVARVNSGIEMQTITELVKEHGHEWVRQNAPSGHYEEWRRAMVAKGDDPDSV